MPIGRHERILAIDGDYIHVSFPLSLSSPPLASFNDMSFAVWFSLCDQIMPTDNKAFFDSMKTSSFHVTSIISCKQSNKSPTNFKIVIWRDDAEKRYDFEAENPRQAAEIISALRAL